jgi:K+-transporting ATPase c subunit
MLYVNEGLKNTVCSPSFTDVRDGIIQAAVDNYDGEDVCVLWDAFAGFGLGVNAVSGGPWSLLPTNGFDIPPACLGPHITAPPPGSTLAGSDVTFEWDAAGQNVTEWWLYIGNTEGANDIYDSGSLGTSTSTLVTGLPVDGRTIHVRLRFTIDGGPWEFNDFSYATPDLIPFVVSPVPGSVLPVSQATFQWNTNGSTVDDWQLQLGSAQGGSDLFDSGPLGPLATSVLATGLPNDGRTVHARLSFLMGGVWDFRDYIYTAGYGDPEITSPVEGSTLAGDAVTFEWVPNGAPVTDYQIYVGTSVGGSSIFDSGSMGTETSINVPGIPTDGRTIYARLWSYYLNSWHTRDFTYTAADLSPELIDPVPGSTLTSSDVTFTWTSNGAPVTDYRLYLGSSLGGYDLLNSGSLGVATSIAASLPTDGRTIYARLWYRVGGVWTTIDYTYTAADLSPELVDPVPGSTLTSSDVTFTWTSNGAPVTDYRLYLGSTFAGYDLLSSGSLGLATSIGASLPTDGRTIYARLWYRVGGLWKTIDYTYTAADLQPELTDPAPGSTLTGANVAFSWTSNGAPVTEWKLYLGTTLGGYNLLNSGPLTTTSIVATELPTDGSTIYARLLAKMSGRWSTTDYVYTAATVIAISMDSPVPGSVLPGEDVTFQWSAAGTVTDYVLQIGSSIGASDLYDSGSLGTATSVNVTGLPVDGSAIFVRLNSTVDGNLQTDDFTYTAADFTPTMVSPPPGSTINGGSATFQWTDNGAAVTNWQLQIGTTPGGAEVDDTGVVGPSITSRVVSTLPIDGSTVYARLSYLIDGVWSAADFQYVAGPGIPELVEPVPGSVLTAADATFSWSANGSDVDNWRLYLGTSLGGYDILDSGYLSSATSITVSGLPVNGSTIYARLWYRIDSVWQTSDYSYTAATLQPELTTPVPGSVLTESSATFAWDDGGAPVTNWRLYLGTSPGGYNIFNSGYLNSATSVTVSNLPIDGSTIYARLWYRIGTLWKTLDYSYTAATLQPELTTPVPGSLLSGSSVTFAWDDDGAPVTNWRLYLGNSPGQYNLFNSGYLAAGVLSVDVSNLPTDARTIHARLWYRVNGTWKTRDYQYTAADLVPELLSPTPGSVLPGTSATFEWTSNGAPVTDWKLYLGTTAAGYDILNSGSLGAQTSITVNNLPTTGQTIYARLWAKVLNVWKVYDYQYTAASP